MSRGEAALAKERARLYEMKKFERLYADRFSLMCGVDEAGRGPLAGPVVAAAVILPEDEILYVNDSKKVSEKRREALYDEICEKAVAVGVGFAHEDRIDEINILQATYEAMRMAVARLPIAPDLLLIDAVHLPDVSTHQISIVHGDALCYSIAAASIIAKVTRDRLMREYDIIYPEYGFAKHKGYGTKAHRDALLEYGPCPIHRRSFLGKILGDNSR